MCDFHRHDKQNCKNEECISDIMVGPNLNRFLSISAQEIRSKWSSPLSAFTSLVFRPRGVKFYQTSRVKLCRHFFHNCPSSITCPSPPHKIRAENLLTIRRL